MDWLYLTATFDLYFLHLSKTSANVQILWGGCAQGRIPEDTRHWSLDAQAPTGVSSPTSIAPGRQEIHESAERNAVVYFRLSEEATASRNAAGPSRGKETAHKAVDYTSRSRINTFSGGARRLVQRSLNESNFLVTKRETDSTVLIKTIEMKTRGTNRYTCCASVHCYKLQCICIGALQFVVT